MKIASLVILVASTQAFAPAFRPTKLSTALSGYLDDIKKYTQVDEEPEEDDSREATQLADNQKDRFGVGDWSGYVEFSEFDGGDGQMGVAGDGKKGLDKEWSGQAQMSKSKMMSAKNAFGRTTGYAETLRAQGVDTARAQQIENWHNQQEVIKERKQQKFMTEDFDQVSADDSWRALSSYNNERLSDTNLDEQFGAVVPGNNIVTTIELNTRLNRAEVFEFDILNSFMGYSDFRAAFTPETSPEWTVEPSEGSLSGKKETPFTVKYRPSNPGHSEGYLVIQTEDDKWTFKLSGTASM